MTFSLSLFLGLISITGFFLLSFILVVGAKTVILTTKKFFAKNDAPPPKIEKEPLPKKPKTVKSIEIDPALVDKIYVKKTS